MAIVVLVLLLVVIALGSLLLEVGERLGNGKLKFSKRTPISLVCTLMILYIVISKIFNMVL